MYRIKSIFVFLILSVLFGCSDNSAIKEKENAVHSSTKSHYIQVKTILLHNRNLIFSDVIIVPENTWLSISRDKKASYDNDKISFVINAFKTNNLNQKAVQYKTVFSENNNLKMHKFEYLFDYEAQENTTLRHKINKEYEIIVKVELIK